MLWAHFGLIIFSGSFFSMQNFISCGKNFASRQKKFSGHILEESFFLAVFHGKILFCVKKFCRQTKKMLWAHFGWIIFSGQFFLCKISFWVEKILLAGKKNVVGTFWVNHFFWQFFLCKISFFVKKILWQAKKMLWAHFGWIIFSGSFFYVKFHLGVEKIL